jgi:hypothetical protein
MTTKNDKMVTNINQGVKRHIGNTKCARLDIKILFLTNMKVEGVGYNIGGHQKYIRDVAGIILYYITFWTRGRWEA